MVFKNQNFFNRKINMNKDKEIEAFKTTLSKFLTGITVVTAIDDVGDPIGMTVNSFSSVSLDPPLVLWSIDKKQPSYNFYKKSNGYVVNILSKNQLELVERAGRLHDKVVLFLDSFTTVGFELGQATDAYEKAVEQLSRGSGNVIRQTEMLKELGAKTKKELRKE